MNTVPSPYQGMSRVCPRGEGQGEVFLPLDSKLGTGKNNFRKEGEKDEKEASGK